MNNPGFIRDITGRYKIGESFDGECSAPTVTDTHTGRVVGVYLDDSTPDLKSWVEKAAAKYPDGIVFVSLPPDARWRHRPSPPVVNLLEVYPFHGFQRVKLCFPLPRCNGYICQDRFDGFAGTKPPNRLQRRWLLRRIKAKHPRYLFLY